MLEKVTPPMTFITQNKKNRRLSEASFVLDEEASDHLSEAFCSSCPKPLSEASV